MKKLVLIILAVASVAGCEKPTIAPQTGDSFATPERDEEEGRIYITDGAGKRWDITQAVELYNFDPARFQNGVGANLIPPILTPRMAYAGDEVFPDTTDTFLVVGVDLNGTRKAYPLSEMATHEVVDEQFGEAYVAVTY